MGRKKEHPGLQDQCRFGEVDEAPEWISLAWRKRRNERTPWVQLGLEFDRDWRTVRDNVRKYGKLVADAYRRGDVDELAEYLEGLHDDKDAQIEAAQKAMTVFVTKDGEVVSEPDWRTRVAARKEVTAIREKVAAALGVVTKREGREQSGSVDVNVLGKLKGATRQSMIDDLESPDGEAEPAANGEGG